MTLDWTTVLFETINFVVLMLLLRRFLFRPAREAVAERRTLLEDAQQEVEGAREAADAAVSNYAAKAQGLAEQAESLRRAARKDGEGEATRLVEVARAQAEKHRADAARRAQQMFVETIREVRPEIARVVVKATGRLIREVGGGDVSLAFARKGAREIQKSADGSRSGARVEVLVSPDVDLYAASGVLREVLGDAEIELEVDESVIGGARFICGPTQVDSSAGAALERWLERLVEVPEPA